MSKPLASPTASSLRCDSFACPTSIDTILDETSAGHRVAAVRLSLVHVSFPELQPDFADLGHPSCLSSNDFRVLSRALFLQNCTSVFLRECGPPQISGSFGLTAEPCWVWSFQLHGMLLM